MNYEKIEKYKKQGEELELIAGHTIRHLNSFMTQINQINFNIKPNIENISKKTNIIKDSLSKNRIKLNEQLVHIKILDNSSNTSNNKNIFKIEIEEIYTIPYLVDLKNNLMQDLDFSLFEKSHNDITGYDNFNMLTNLIGSVLLRLAPLLNQLSVFSRVTNHKKEACFMFYFNKEDSIKKLILQQTSHDQLMSDLTSFRVKASFISQDFMQLLRNVLKDLNTIYKFLENDIK